jgi:aspartyl-tRNA(Asn)/glutamyl-tRNA(Gln) amidotransferase subunit C
LREDVVKDTITQKEALLNAPKKDSDYFKVAKVIDQK